MTPSRRDKGTGALYKRADGMWVGAVSGYAPDGRRKRVTVSSKNKGEAQRKLRELVQSTEGGAHLPERGTTVQAWLGHWLSSIAAKRVRPRTLATYRTYINQYLVPHLGRRRLDQLQPQHVRGMHDAILKQGLSTTTALQAHAILSKSLTDAMREGRVTRNVAELVDRPRKAANTRDALTPEQAATLLRSVDKTPMGARWAAALFLGARQGECLGLEWDRVDLERGVVDLSWQLQRLPYRHACKPPCGHKRAGNCPQRQLAVPAGFEHRQINGALCLTRPKSRAGQRVIPLPAPMIDALTWLRANTTSTGLVWTRDGRPIEPSVDNRAWHSALEAAGLPSTPLHSARHCTATLLLRLGVDTRVVQSILGHSSAATSQGYMHVDLTLQRDAMQRLGTMLAIERTDP